MRWALYQPSRFEQIAPGQVIGFDMGSYDIKLIANVMKVLSENGYRMLTCNELFEYEPNLPDEEGG